MKLNCLESKYRTGFGGYGAVFDSYIVYDEHSISSTYKSILDVYLQQISYIPIANIIVEIINNIRQIYSNLKNNPSSQFNYQSIEDNEIFSIPIKTIKSITITQKTSFHTWLIELIIYFPLMELFVFSLGGCVLTIKYKPGKFQKTKKIILPSPKQKKILLNHIIEHNNLIPIYNKNRKLIKEVFFTLINLSFAIFMLSVIVYKTYEVVIIGSSGQLDSNVAATILLLVIAPLTVKLYISAKSSYESFKHKYY